MDQDPYPSHQTPSDREVKLASEHAYFGGYQNAQKAFDELLLRKLDPELYYKVKMVLHGLDDVDDEKLPEYEDFCPR